MDKSRALEEERELHARDVIDGYKAGLAGESLGIVSDAFDRGHLIGCLERAPVAAQPRLTREALLTELGQMCSHAGDLSQFADCVAWRDIEIAIDRAIESAIRGEAE